MLLGGRQVATVSTNEAHVQSNKSTSRKLTCKSSMPIGTALVTAPDPVMPPREPEEDRRPAASRPTESCPHDAPQKPIGVAQANRQRALASFSMDILGHLIAHGSTTPLRIRGRIVRHFCVWLGYPCAFGVPSSGGASGYKHKIEYVGMLVHVGWNLPEPFTMTALVATLTSIIHAGRTSTADNYICLKP